MKSLNREVDVDRINVVIVENETSQVRMTREGVFISYVFCYVSFRARILIVGVDLRDDFAWTGASIFIKDYAVRWDQEMAHSK